MTSSIKFDTPCPECGETDGYTPYDIEHEDDWVAFCCCGLDRTLSFVPPPSTEVCGPLETSKQCQESGFDGRRVRMRSKCKKCGTENGVVRVRGGQRCVYCTNCSAFAYNAPVWELTGETRPDPTGWPDPGLRLDQSSFWLYRAFGIPDGSKSDHEQLLYVGQTSNPQKRMRQHAGREGGEPKPWASMVTRLTFEVHSSRGWAMEAESRAIQLEQPIYNKIYKTGEHWDTCSTHVQLVTLDPSSLHLHEPRWDPSAAYADPLTTALTAMHVAKIAVFRRIAQREGSLWDNQGDPIVFAAGWLSWFCEWLPKVTQGALEFLVEDGIATSVEGAKPREIPCPDFVKPEYRLTDPEWASIITEYPDHFPTREWLS